jgi:hypothetical protein
MSNRDHQRGLTPTRSSPPTPTLLRFSGNRLRGLVGAALCISLALGLPTQATGQARTPEEVKEIVDRVDRLLRGESSRARVTMEIETENWSRGLEMEMWSLGNDFALVRVLSPQKEAGTATLKAGQEVWNYLPRVDRTIKVPASLMMGSWMGSHFTNDDLVKESSMAEDYDIELTADEIREGEAIWEFTLIPRPDAPVVWGAVTMVVRQADLMPTRVQYFDEDRVAVRTMVFSEFRQMDGRLVPALITVIPEDKPGERTVVRYNELTFDIPIEESFFSLRNLRSGS